MGEAHGDGLWAQFDRREVSEWEAKVYRKLLNSAWKPIMMWSKDKDCYEESCGLKKKILTENMKIKISENLSEFFTDSIACEIFTFLGIEIIDNAQVIDMTTPPIYTSKRAREELFGKK